MQDTLAKNRRFYAILAMLVLPLSGLGIDIYVPSLPAVSEYYGVDKALVQLSVTTYMLGLGLVQLFGGSLSDSFGRKKPFLIAMALFIVASFWVPFSKDIYQLLLFRLIQGGSIAVVIVPMRSVILDLFTGHELLKMLNYMTIAWSIGPIIAPAIGGYFQHYFGWQSNFYFLTLYSVVMFLLVLIYMPETSAYRHSFHIAEILKRYKKIIFSRQFVAGLLMNGVLYSFVIIFGIVGPFLIQVVMGYSAIEFGRVALLMGVAWFMGTMSNRFLLHINLRIKTKVCLLLMTLIVVLMLVLALTTFNLYSVTIPTFFLFWVAGILFPNYFAHSLALFPKATGSANALFGSAIFVIAGVSSALATLLKSNSILPLTFAYLMLLALCFCIFFGIMQPAAHQK
ncbi:MAG: multidrug effflux MFS transporter [Gammaproteobacteria bacterium]|nr:multidrug effflux MFS transporter [Gammaproteobacteria bacterium]